MVLNVYQTPMLLYFKRVCVHLASPGVVSGFLHLPFSCWELYKIDSPLLPHMAAAAVKRLVFSLTLGLKFATALV